MQHSSQHSSFGSLAGRVIASAFFGQAQRRASRLARNGKGLLDLLAKVSAKSGSVRDMGFLDNLRTLSRLVNASARGQYKAVPWATLLKAIAALVYFVSPVDFIPDLLPVLGFADDIAVVLWVLKSCAADIETFRAWEMAQNRPA